MGKNRRIKKLSPSFKIFFKILKPLKDFGKIDYKFYTTEVEKLKEKIYSRVNELNTKERNKQMEAILNLLTDISYVKYNKQFKNDINKRYKSFCFSNKNFHLLYILFNKVDSKFKNSASLILFGTSLDDLYRRCVEPIDLLEQIKIEKGEYRAKITIRAFREVSEMLYDSYLRIMYEMVFLLRKNKKTLQVVEINTAKKSFGNVINALQNYSKELHNIKKLIEFDAGWIRNACSHSNWKYIPKEDSLLLWDNKITPQKIPVDVIIKKVFAMYKIAGPDLLELYQIYIAKNFFIKQRFFEMCFMYLNNLKKGHNNEILNNKFEKKYKTMFRECSKLKFIR